MILILFISLCIAWCFYRYFENKRIDRLKEQQEKRKDAYEQLLKIISEKEDNKHTNT